MNVSNIFLIILFFTVSVYAQGKKCTGKPNNLPIFTSPPTYLRNTTNGILYQSTQVNPPLYVCHVYGTPYEMGYAQGTLLKQEITDLYTEFEAWVEGQIGQYLGDLPEFLKKMIEEFGIEAGLEFTYEATKDYTPAHFFEELKGISDATGIEYMQVVRFHMFPELIKAHCSMYGAWGPAIAQTDGTMYQLRALDWGTNGPFQKWPQVTIYHPKSTNGHAFANVGWSGFIGALTGFSSAPVGICEKVWLNYNGTDSRFGVPFYFLLRDILQYDSDTDSALTRIANAERTCSIFVGLGDYTNRFKVVEYSHEWINILDNHNFIPYSGHPNIPGIVYIDKHTQPSHDPCLGSLLELYYGHIDARTTIRNITSVFQTGDMHIGIYDFKHNEIYVANAAPCKL